ncbi:MAG: carbohydrate ABC transporter permease [Acidimicrobiales bacterium]
MATAVARAREPRLPGLPRLPRLLPEATLAGRERRLAMALLAPTFVGLCAVLAYPMVQTIIWSFQHYVLTDPAHYFNGVADYRQAFRTRAFWGALEFTVLYAVLSVAGQVVVGFVVALIANRQFRGRWLVRAALLFPWMMPTVITAVVWRFMYDPSYGLFNGILEHLGLPHAIVWLGGSTLAIVSLLILSVWKVNSFAALVFLAGMQSIPREVYEAADVDGARPWQRFWRVTLPLLRPTILVVLVLRTVEALQAFDIIYGLTLGGPGNATQNLPLYLYQQSIQGLDFGYGSAMGVILAFLIAIFAVVYLRLLYRPEPR